MAEKRDFREETLLNAAEFSLLREMSGDLGIAKAAVLRYCLHVVGNEFIKNKRLKETGIVTED